MWSLPVTIHAGFSPIDEANLPCFWEGLYAVTVITLSTVGVCECVWVVADAWERLGLDPFGVEKVLGWKFNHWIC